MESVLGARAAKPLLPITYPTEWNPDIPLEAYKHNLRRIVELGRAQGAEVWLLTSPHAFLTDENRGQYDKFPNTSTGKGLLRINGLSIFDRSDRDARHVQRCHA